MRRAMSGHRRRLAQNGESFPKHRLICYVGSKLKCPLFVAHDMSGLS